MKSNKLVSGQLSVDPTKVKPDNVNVDDICKHMTKNTLVTEVKKPYLQVLVPTTQHTMNVQSKNSLTT